MRLHIYAAVFLTGVLGGWGCSGDPAMTGATPQTHKPAGETAAGVEAGGRTYPANPASTTPAETKLSALIRVAENVPKSGANSVGLETASGWSAESWRDANACKVVSANFPNSPTRLFVTFAGGTRKGMDKAAFSALVPGIVLAKDAKVSARVYNPGSEPFEVALALNTGESYVHYETQPARVASGWNTLSFDVSAKEWKSAASGWQYTTSVERAQDVRKVIFVIYNGPRDGALYFEGITLPHAVKEPVSVDTPSMAPSQSKRPPAQNEPTPKASPQKATEPEEADTAKRKKLLDIIGKMGQKE